MAKHNVTLRDIAEEAGVAVSSVSRALKGNPRIPKQTRERIEFLAEEMGYIARPGLSAAAAGRFRTPAKDSMESIAYLWFAPHDLKAGCHAQYVFELLQRAGKKMGYRLKTYSVSTTEIPALLRSLYQQGFVGIILGSWIDSQPPLCSEWRLFSVIGLGGLMKSMPFHFIEEDYFRSATTTIEKAVACGYRRIGLAPLSHVPRLTDDRRRLGGLLGAHVELLGKTPEIPPLLTPLDDQQSYCDWVKTYHPDCIISFHISGYRWLMEMGRNVPEDLGYIALHTPTETAFNFVSGMRPMDEQTALITIKAMDSAYRTGDRGPLEASRHTFVASQWQEGATLRTVQ